MKFIGTAAFALSMASVVIGAKLSESAAMDGAKSQCTTGDISCCNSKEETEADGILGNLLAGGLLNGLLGNSNSACAKTSLLDDLNILSSTRDTDSGPVCKNIIACCPEGTKECIAVDNSGSK
ncbi:uncharacterized protein N7511_009424 [Penicillium nucicola]|uniref:uncharacterized protein n=1 Tax=Penicillium nucicola TaxID=1850975 RepID=UPI002545BD59|nr:uncharacterized protein N7511_009424 [Penicillium nucicola]KAJ5747728.1 hypothetical protein N7511_009424 [Penicillium nucicola]